MKYQGNGEIAFTFVEPEKSRGRSLVASIGVHAVLFTGLLLLPLFLIEPVRTPKYDMTLLAPAEDHRDVVVEHLKAPVLPKPKPVVIPPPVKPLPAPVIAEVKPPLPVIRVPEVHIEPKPVPVPAPAPVVVEQPRFETPVAEVKPAAPRPTVQTGGFGDVNGSSAKSLEKQMNAARVGSFDLPAGEGTGNGKGGTRGIVSTSGFDSAGAGSSATAAKAKSVQVASGFDTPQVSKQAAQRAVKPIEVPVEITSKPRPEYSEDARRMRIEGEVSLRVLFAATGRVRVLGLVKGLGYGLDEKAYQAAERIQFKPAISDGAPVDSTAIVRIAFQLAY